MYAIVLDFEATCWDSHEYIHTPLHKTDHKKARRCEIIEFPMMVMDCDTLQVPGEEDVFHEYVRPVKDPRLSDFCTQLTGITQQTVDGVDPFPDVFKRAQAFLGQRSLFPDNSVFVTVGNWDLEQMLPLQVELSVAPQKRIPHLFRRWVNIKKLFVDCRAELPLIHTKKERGSGSLAGMLRSAGLVFDGRPHSGIDDTRNTCTLLAWILRHSGEARAMMAESVKHHKQLA